MSGAGCSLPVVRAVTGKKNFVFLHEGCSKAFSLNFNLKAHMKTHSAYNYHVCKYPGCTRSFSTYILYFGDIAYLLFSANQFLAGWLGQQILAFSFSTFLFIVRY
ncbi:hypothetical protein GUJ93_ZPchr0010g10502 [Zizania palustris]|uniref:C2H2-type domain-containing protein n=1 Tax=Zizania palustris TaxID=103762 RepID=A0A8J5WD39_ZIZPA|nr:hypothetical protein GUJ93_ZPchr0010g10502 [Zizania palustris]